MFRVVLLWGCGKCCLGGVNYRFLLFDIIMKWVYFRLLSKSENSYKSIIPDGLELRVRKPRSMSVHDLLWTFLSLGRYCEYILVDKVSQRVVSKAQVMPKIFIFQFMTGKRGLHIGPCSTIKEYRGKGFYPLLLSCIFDDYRNKVDTFYIFCDENNIASIRGIKKVGFSAFGRGCKNRFGIYVVKELL